MCRPAAGGWGGDSDRLGGSNNPFGSLISITATMLSGRLDLTLNYNQRIVSDERLSRVVTATMNALHQAERAAASQVATASANVSVHVADGRVGGLAAEGGLNFA